MKCRISLSEFERKRMASSTATVDESTFVQESGLSGSAARLSWVLAVPVGPQALSAPIPDHSTVRTGRTGFCDPTTSRPLLKAPWAAKHQRHEPSNQTHGLIATAAGKLAERGPGQFLADPAADILYESDHTVNGIVISAKVYTTTKHEGKQPK
jgi:hypothetical protein